MEIRPPLGLSAAGSKKGTLDAFQKETILSPAFCQPALERTWVFALQPKQRYEAMDTQNMQSLSTKVRQQVGFKGTPRPLKSNQAQNRVLSELVVSLAKPFEDNSHANLSSLGVSVSW